MQIIGTIVIVATWIACYYIFKRRKLKETQKDRELREVFNRQLDNQLSQKNDFKVVYAGGDDNSENHVHEAINRIKMSQAVRIRNYGQS